MIKTMRYLRLKIFAVVLVAIGFNLGKAHATERPWQTHQYVIGAMAVAAHVADWGQTRHIATSAGRYEEADPITRRIIGKSPTTSAVDVYMGLTGLAFLTAAHLLPEYRTAILSVWAVTRVHVVVSNHEIGLRVGGSF